MILTLLAVSLNDQALSRPITARFDAAGGTIGRADHSTMALPDPERFISRKQAEIVCVADGFMIRNVGAANPITVAQRALAAGEAAPLRHGDEVRIGGYLLRAQVGGGAGSGRAATGDVAATVASGVQAPARPLAPPPPAAAFGASPALASDNPFADLFGSAAAPAGAPVAAVDPAGAAGAAGAADSPFADLLGPATPASAPAPAPALARAPSVAPAAARGTPSAADDPFADLMPPPAGITASLGGVAAPASAAGGARLPDDFDPFASGSAGLAPSPRSAPSPASLPDDWGLGTASAAPAGASASAADPFADLFGDGSGARAGAPSIDQAFGLSAGGAGGDDALARFVGEAAGGPGPAPAAGGGASLPTDPLLLFGAEPAGTAAPPPAGQRAPAGPVALPDDLPAVHGAFTPPRVPSPSPPPPTSPPPHRRDARPAAGAGAPTAGPAAPARAAPLRPPAASPARAAAPTSAADSAALWRAFCEGAGIDLPAPGGEGEALMRHIGRVLRAAVEGTLQLVAVRASTKHEMRAQVTQIRSSANNPLKFSPDAASGLAQLLTPPQRGFLDGAAAMDDAMQDLVGHSIGTVAGMRAAIEGMLARFDPAALESQLGAGSRLANLLPMNRKARLWELYLQHHRQIRNEAEEDFHTVFGRAFVAAYEEQVDRLEQQQRQRQGPRR
jgi:FHA domain-containing protein